MDTTRGAGLPQPPGQGFVTHLDTGVVTALYITGNIEAEGTILELTFDILETAEAGEYEIAVGLTNNHPDNFSSGSGLEDFQQLPIHFTPGTITLKNSGNNSGNSTGGGGGGGANPAPSPVNPSAEPESGKWSNPFADVQASDWFYADVEYAVTKGLFNGVSAEKFEPRLNMTRAMAITVLARLAGADTSVSGGEQWYTKAVAWGIENNITDGQNLNDNITREQLVTLLWRYSKSPLSNLALTFADSDSISAYAKSAVAWAAENKVVQGKGGNIFDPNGSATRAEVAAMLLRPMTAE